CTPNQIANALFTGDEHDAESNTEHTDFRQLATTQGRWLSPDPMTGSITNPQSWNKYTYGWNDPVNKVDRNGKWPTDVHHDILTWALPGLSASDLGAVIQGSDSVDRLYGQTFDAANAHSM